MNFGRRCLYGENHYNKECERGGIRSTTLFILAAFWVVPYLGPEAAGHNCSKAAHQLAFRRLTEQDPAEDAFRSDQMVKPVNEIIVIFPRTTQFIA